MIKRKIIVATPLWQDASRTVPGFESHANDCSQSSLKRSVEDGRQQRVEFGGGLGLEVFHRVHLSKDTFALDLFFNRWDRNFDIQKLFRAGSLDILQAMIDFGCYFTIGVEVHYSDHIKAISKLIPDHLLLTETDNPGAIKWLNKNDEIGMPTAIQNVVEAVAELRNTTPERIERLVEANFGRMIEDDQWLDDIRRVLS